ncbi:MAG: tetratricopeptide repeat protein [Leptolyngbyaceae cyanobacterium]
MPHFLFHQCLRLLSIAGVTLAGWILSPMMVWAQAVPAEVRDPFLADPELMEPRDPLLPELPVVRRLSPLEKVELETALDELAAEGERLHFQGETDRAFQVWMREVRLRRVLGYEAEIQAMQRVGLRAWEDSRSQETQLLTLRLRQIQAELLSQEPLDIPLLESVAATFEVLRDIDSAIAVYETLIVRAAQAGDREERQRLLENLASLQESWFRFEVAGKTYQSLLVANNGSDALKQVEYLQGAIRNYQDAGELSTTVGLQRRLLAQYQTTSTLQPIPALLLAIARNYRDLEDLPQARTYYLIAHSTAFGQNQTNIAREAVEDLTAIYAALERPADVLYLYQQQIALDRLSYDGYELMQVFDKLGQFHETQGEPDAAITAYQEGLILATHLKHREVYFKYQLLRLLYAQDRLTGLAVERHQHDPAIDVLQQTDIWQGNR